MFVCAQCNLNALYLELKSYVVFRQALLSILKTQSEKVAQSIIINDFYPQKKNHGKIF